jgi:uncharacterized protein YwgA
MDVNELSPVQIAILTLLKSKNINGVECTPIPGMTHIVKELFAIKMTPLGDKLLSDLSFEPDNYGPFDETIYAALDDLSRAGLVGLEDTGSYVRIKLTEKGQKLEDIIWKKLRNDIVSLFTYVKMNYNHLSSNELLDKIYSAYPEMTKYSISKVAEKYR